MSLIDVSEADGARAIRAMLELLEQIETLMNAAAYTEEAEARIGALRAQWTHELAEYENAMIGQWHSTIAKR